MDLIIFPPEPEQGGRDHAEVLYDMYKDTVIVMLRQSEKSRILCSNMRHATIHYTAPMDAFLNLMKSSSFLAKQQCLVMLNFIALIRRDLDEKKSDDAEAKMTALQDFVETVEKEIDDLIQRLGEFCVAHLPDEPDIQKFMGIHFISTVRKIRLTPLHHSPLAVLEPIEESESGKINDRTGTQGLNLGVNCMSPTNTKLTATTTSQTKRIVMDAGTKGTDYRVEYYLLQAPAGMKVQITPKVLGTRWSNSCDPMGMEVKFLKDARPSGLQVCDWRVQQPTITSETNEMLVQTYTLEKQFAVELEYKAVN